MNNIDKPILEGQFFALQTLSYVFESVTHVLKDVYRFDNMGTGGSWMLLKQNPFMAPFKLLQWHSSAIIKLLI